MLRLAFAALIAIAPTGFSTAARQIVLPPVEYPDLPRSAADAEGFAPQGWTVERRASGDLDRDGRSDLAFVVRMADPRNVLRHDGLGEDPFDTNPRILAVAFASPDGGYRLTVQDRLLIPRREFPAQADPFRAEDTEFAIARGTLRVSLYRFMSAGGWDMGPAAFVFRWQDGALRLIGFDYTNVKRNSGCVGGLSVNYLTRRARYTLSHISTDREQERWERLPRRPLLALGEVGDGLAFDAGGLLERLPWDCHGAGLAPEDEGG